MTKPLARLGVSIDERTWRLLQKVDAFAGVRAFNFTIEGGQPMVWLVYAAENADVFSRLHDITTKQGGLPMKSAGEQLDWSETSFTYLRATVRLARAETVLRTPGGLPMSEHSAASEEYEAAKRERDNAKSAFEAALVRDARQLVDDEQFERLNRERRERDRESRETL